MRILIVEDEQKVAWSRVNGGTGLGSSIARWAVEMKGGLIEVKSSPGKGTIFSITLPNKLKRTRTQT